MPKLAKGQTLTNKERIFCLEYVKHFNGTRAAIAAGYSKKSAHYQATEILARPRVKKELEQLLAEHAMTAVEVLARLSDIARVHFANLIELHEVPVLDKDGKHVGNVQRIQVKPDAIEKYGYLIRSIKNTEHGIQIEVYDPLRALELIGKAIGLFRDHHIHLNMAALTDDQLERLGKGESPIHVILYPPEMTNRLDLPAGNVIDVPSANVE
jgi:phage terminase small subunit